MEALLKAEFTMQSIRKLKLRLPRLFLELLHFTGKFLARHLGQHQLLTHVGVLANNLLEISTIYKFEINFDENVKIHTNNNVVGRLALVSPLLDFS